MRSALIMPRSAYGRELRDTVGLACSEERVTAVISKMELGRNENAGGTLVRLRKVCGVALLAALAGCTGRPDGIEPIRPFNAQLSKGEWFEIMRLDHSFERGLTNVTATYTLRDDGSDGGAQHWAVLASLIATCKLNDFDPYAYLADVLAKLVGRHPMSRIEELLPFAYVKPNGQQRAAA